MTNFFIRKSKTWIPVDFSDENNGFEYYFHYQGKLVAVTGKDILNGQIVLGPPLQCVDADEKHAKRKKTWKTSDKSESVEAMLISLKLQLQSMNAKLEELKSTSGRNECDAPRCEDGSPHPLVALPNEPPMEPKVILNKSKKIDCLVLKMNSLNNNNMNVSLEEFAGSLGLTCIEKKKRQVESNKSKVVNQRLKRLRKTSYSGGKCPYSLLEDRIILNFVSADEEGREHLVKGNRMWKSFEKHYRSTTNIVRTWQSLRNRYLKHILPMIGQYGLSPEQVRRLRAAAITGEIKHSKVKCDPKENSIFKEKRVMSAWRYRRVEVHKSSSSSSSPSPSPSPDPIASVINTRRSKRTSAPESGKIHERREEIKRQEEEARKRKELEEIMIENNKNIKEARRKLFSQSAMIVEQRKMDGERQKLKK